MQRPWGRQRRQRARQSRLWRTSVSIARISSAPARKTKLGEFLRTRLEIEVNAAIQRGERRIADSVTLLTREESAKA
jgi:hypothetical protein